MHNHYEMHQTNNVHLREMHERAARHRLAKHYIEQENAANTRPNSQTRVRWNPFNRLAHA